MKSRLILVQFLVFLSFNTSYSQWIQTDNLAEDVHSLAASGNYLIAGTWSSGVFRSTNFGNEWTNCGLNNSPIPALAFNGNDIFAGNIGGGISKSTDFGNTWFVSLGPLDGLGNPQINCITVYNNIIYAGKKKAAADARNFLYTTNNGQNWINASAGLFATEVMSIAVIDNQIFAGTYNGTSGIFWSTNNGINWAARGLYSVYGLAVINNTLFASSLTNAVYTSSNFGISWQTVYSGLPVSSRVYRLLSYGNYLFAGTYENGVFLTTNMGQSWLDINSGLGDFHIRSFCISEPYIFAGTSSYVWKRHLSEITSVNKAGNNIPGQFRLYQNYPNPFNPVTKIKFDIPQFSIVAHSIVKLVVYNAAGKEIQTLVDNNLVSGSYEYVWNSSDFPSGIYFYTLSFNGMVETRKMVLIK